MRAGPILLYVIGIVFFCVMDALMKHLVASYPVVVATFWRFAAALPFILSFWWREGLPPVTREMLPVNILRASASAVSALLLFWSFSVLPLAEAITLAFVAPLMIPPLAALLLKERLAAGSVAAGVAGFAGVLVAVGFDPTGLTRERQLGVGAVLVSAALYALQVVLTRMRAARDGPSLLSLLNALFSGLFVGLAMLWQVPAAQWLPSAGDIPWVLAVGFSGAVALQFIARAYARAQAQHLAPFEYTALFWAALFGWLFFSEPVSLRTWAGAALIAGACLWQARRGVVPTPSSPAA